MKTSLCLAGLILFILSFSGCSTTTPTGCRSNETWYRPNTTPEQTQHDLALCQYDALSNRRATSVSGDTVGQTILLRMVADSSEDSKKSQLIAAEMTAKGYTLVKKNAPLSKALAEESRIQQTKVSPQMEAQLVGRWESVSFKTKIATADQTDIAKQVFVFFSNQRMLDETIFKNEKINPGLSHYYIDGDKFEMIDPFVAPQYRRTTAAFSLIENQLILTSGNAQIVMQKVTEINAVPDMENLLLGEWHSEFQTNAVKVDIKFKAMPHNRYNYKLSFTSPDKSSNENEDGVFCYDAQNSEMYCWSDKESEPQRFECHVVEDEMRLVIGKVAWRFSRGAN
jgi:hypothetical protein